MASNDPKIGFSKSNYILASVGHSASRRTKPPIDGIILETACESTLFCRLFWGQALWVGIDGEVDFFGCEGLDAEAVGAGVEKAGDIESEGFADEASGVVVVDVDAGGGFGVEVLHFEAGAGVGQVEVGGDGQLAVVRISLRYGAKGESGGTNGLPGGDAEGPEGGGLGPLGVVEGGVGPAGLLFLGGFPGGVGGDEERLAVSVGEGDYADEACGIGGVGLVGDGDGDAVLCGKQVRGDVEVGEFLPIVEAAGGVGEGLAVDVELDGVVGGEEEGGVGGFEVGGQGEEFAKEASSDGCSGCGVGLGVPYPGAVLQLGCAGQGQISGRDVGLRCRQRVDGDGSEGLGQAWLDAWGEVAALRAQDEEEALVGFEGEVQFEAGALSLEGYGGDFVAEGVPTFGKARRGEAEAVGAGQVVGVLVADEEDVRGSFYAVEDVEPVVGVAFDDFEGGMDGGVAGEDLLELFGSRLGGQEVGAAFGGAGIAEVEAGLGIGPEGLGEGVDVVVGAAYGGGFGG